MFSNQNLQEVLLCLGVSFSVGAAAAWAMGWARHRFDLVFSEGCTTVIAAFVAFVATLFSFLLGFTIVNLWSNFSDAERLAEREATLIRTLYRLSRGVVGGEKLAALLHQYSVSIAQDEWPAMRSGITSAKTDRIKDAVWDETIALVKADNQNATLAQSLTDHVIELNTHRRERMSMLKSRLHPLLLLGLGASGVFTAAGFLLLGIKRRRLQFTIDFTMAGAIALNFYLLQALDEPFSGTGFAVANTPYVELARRIDPGMVAAGRPIAAQDD